MRILGGDGRKGKASKHNPVDNGRPSSNDNLFYSSTATTFMYPLQSSRTSFERLI
jgi:hypothetical protein